MTEKPSRSIRYVIEIERQDGSKDVIQANSRRKDAIKRAQFVAQDKVGWPKVIAVRVIDTMGWNLNGERVSCIDRVF